MKRMFTLIAAALVAVVVAVPAFAGGIQQTGGSSAIDVFLLISGSLGDKGFNDSAKAGLDMIKAKYGDKVTVK